MRLALLLQLLLRLARAARRQPGLGAPGGDLALPPDVRSGDPVLHRAGERAAQLLAALAVGVVPPVASDLIRERVVGENFTEHAAIQRVAASIQRRFKRCRRAHDQDLGGCGQGQILVPHNSANQLGNVRVIELRIL